MNPLPQDPNYIDICNRIPTEFATKATIDFNARSIEMASPDDEPFNVTFASDQMVDCTPSLLMSSGAYAGSVVKHLLDGYSASIVCLAATDDDGRLNLSLTCSLVDSDFQQWEAERDGQLKKPGMFTSEMPLWKKLLGGNLWKFLAGGRALERNTAHQPIFFPREETMLHCASTKYHAYKVIMSPEGLVNTTGAGAWVPQEFGPKDYYCMHPHYDPATQSLLTYTFRHSIFAKKTTITFFEYLEAQNSQPRRIEYVINDRVALHMFGFTKNYFIVFANPLKLERCGQVQLLFGKPILRALDDTFISNLVIHFIPRYGGNEAFSVDTQYQGYVYHTMNCFEADDDDRIIIDAFASDLNAARESAQFELNGKHKVYDNNGDPYRFEIYRKHKTVRMTLMDFLVDSTIDFHCINGLLHGQENRYVWVVGHQRSRAADGTFEQVKSILHKMDASNAADNGAYEAEGVYFRTPMFVPRNNALMEDDGYIFMWVYQANGGGTGAAELHILDAHTLCPIVKVSLGANQILPYSVHSWNYYVM